MRRFLTAMLITCFAFGFCLSMTGCGGEDTKAKKADAKDKK